jgi:preprotein translocase subunit SecE
MRHVRKWPRRPNLVIESLFVLSICALMLSAVANADQTTPRYTLIDLGTLGG